jgi:tetratricopeptide (TPR) repeat protein
MIRSGLLLMVMAGASVVGGGNMASGAAAPSPEQTDLQAVQAEEAAVAQAGGDPRAGSERLDEAFARLEKKYPRSATVRDEHGAYLWSKGRNQEAFAKWQEAEKLDGNNPEICAHLGFSWLQNGHARRARGYFEREVALAPEDAGAHDNLGTDLYLFRHQLTTAQEPETAVVDRALAELRKATELEPAGTQYALDYADTFYSIPVAKWPEALKAWQHYYEISPDKDLGAINLARVSLQMKDSAGARRYLAMVSGSGYQSLKKKLMAQAGPE